MTATMVLCGIVSQVLHLTLLPSFPYFALTSPQFILAAGNNEFDFHLGSIVMMNSQILTLFYISVMVVVNHYLAFQFFAENYHPFSEVRSDIVITLNP